MCAEHNRQNCSHEGYTRSQACCSFRFLSQTALTDDFPSATVLAQLRHVSNTCFQDSLIFFSTQRDTGMSGIYFWPIWHSLFVVRLPRLWVIWSACALTSLFRRSIQLETKKMELHIHWKQKGQVRIYPSHRGWMNTQALPTALDGFVSEILNMFFRIDILTSYPFITATSVITKQVIMRITITIMSHHVTSCHG